VTLPRALINSLANGDLRVRAELERSFASADIVETTLAANVAATERLDQATVITLSGNAAFANERILRTGRGITAQDSGATLTLACNDTVPTVSGGFPLVLRVTADSDCTLPSKGQIATTGNVETLQRKTLDAPKLSGLGNYVDDTAAAAGGVPVGGVYRNGSVVMVRVV
jgi:hypothetical protein